VDIIVDPSLTPSGIGIGTSDDVANAIVAITECCHSMVHAWINGALWACGACSAEITSPEQHCSLWYLDSSSFLNHGKIEAWVANWTGFIEEQIEVKIS
jgi:hypothetical protein